MEQVASQCRRGFLRQLLQETSGRLKQGCGTISDAYIHYYYRLQVIMPASGSSYHRCIQRRNCRSSLSVVAANIQLVQNTQTSCDHMDPISKTSRFAYGPLVNPPPSLSKISYKYNSVLTYIPVSFLFL